MDALRKLVPHRRGGASAVKKRGHFEVRKSSNQVRSPGLPDAVKGSSPVVNDLTDLHCTYCAGCVTKSEKKLINDWKVLHLRHYRSRAELGWRIFQPGHLTCRAHPDEVPPVYRVAQKVSNYQKSS